MITMMFEACRTGSKPDRRHDSAARQHGHNYTSDTNKESGETNGMLPPLEGPSILQGKAVVMSTVNEEHTWLPKTLPFLYLLEQRRIAMKLKTLHERYVDALKDLYGAEQVADVLQETLDEEGAADKKMTTLAETSRSSPQ